MSPCGVLFHCLGRFFLPYDLLCPRVKKIELLQQIAMIGTTMLAGGDISDGCFRILSAAQALAFSENVACHQNLSYEPCSACSGLGSLQGAAPLDAGQDSHMEEGGPVCLEPHRHLQRHVRAEAKSVSFRKMMISEFGTISMVPCPEQGPLRPRRFFSIVYEDPSQKRASTSAMGL